MTVMTAPPGASSIRSDEIPWSDVNTREGIGLRAICFSDETARRNIMVAVATLAETMVSPRHKHTFEQLRYYIDGDTRFGDEVYEPGDCVYFPEGVFYGPQHGTPGSNCLHLALQWGGPAGVYYPTQAEQRAARAKLLERGKFEGGVYTRADGSKVDGFEALIEHLSGGPCVYPKPRYDKPIRMRSGAYAELPAPGLPGVWVQRMGFFNETGPEIAMVRLEPGSQVPATQAAGDEVRIVLSGDVGANAVTLDGISFLYTPHGAMKAPLVAQSASKLLVVRYNIPYTPAFL